MQFVDVDYPGQMSTARVKIAEKEVIRTKYIQ